MDGIISATSLAAESLGLGKKIGTLAPDTRRTSSPSPAIRSRTSRSSEVRFVMKGGKVYKK